MKKITIEKCPCGSSSCKYFYLKGIGTFYQGSGFTQNEAQLIANLLNNHYAQQKIEEDCPAR